MNLLQRLSPDEVRQRLRLREPVDPTTLAQAAVIVQDVRLRGEAALREHGERLGDLKPDEPLWLGPEALQAALRELPPDQRGVLERTAAHIRAFALAQRACLQDLRVTVPSGLAGHHVLPLERAGCYAPGGRFPLPSSVLMTAVTARAAGVKEVYVASPRPSPVTLAAAAISGADGLLRVGGAQAIAALAYGAGPVPACDAVVGPGNRYVTAAKQLLAGRVSIDMLAGPSELLIVADGSADPALCAADLLAQAEHDDDAVPMLLTVDPALPSRVEEALHLQLHDLPTAATARAALRNGFAVVASGWDEALALANLLAPEHLELLAKDGPALAPRLRHYGALFLGAGSAEVFGDYGVGPNHVLPTGGTARSTAGLSVFTFLRPRTFLELQTPSAALCQDASALARMEGLEAHARAAARRSPR